MATAGPQYPDAAASVFTLTAADCAPGDHQITFLVTIRPGTASVPDATYWPHASFPQTSMMTVPVYGGGTQQVPSQLPSPLTVRVTP
jgi:hypothetical protein